MTVNQLIELLQKFPGEAKVRVDIWEGDTNADTELEAHELKLVYVWPTFEKGKIQNPEFVVYFDFTGEN